MTLVSKTFIRAFVILVFAVVGCTEKPAPQDSCNFVQNSDSQRVSWKYNLPVSLYVHEAFPAEHLPSLRGAFKHWEDKFGRPLFKLSGFTGGPHIAKRDGVSTIYWMKDWEQEKRSEQARTTIYWESTQIKEADVKFNASNFSLASRSPLKDDDVDVESLSVHELGHVLGLQHVLNTKSVMAVVLGFLEIRNQPFPADVESLKCEY